MTLGGIRRPRHISWDEIAKFQILDPQWRTPFIFAMTPWRDQAQAVLLDGRIVRLRAIEPWHGFTALSLLAARRGTNADRTVESLNSLLARRRSAGR